MLRVVLIFLSDPFMLYKIGFNYFHSPKQKQKPTLQFGFHGSEYLTSIPVGLVNRESIDLQIAA
jgi:hypothetical protein